MLRINSCYVLILVGGKLVQAVSGIMLSQSLLRLRYGGVWGLTILLLHVLVSCCGSVLSYLVVREWVGADCMWEKSEEFLSKSRLE